MSDTKEYQVVLYVEDPTTKSTDQIRKATLEKYGRDVIGPLKEGQFQFFNLKAFGKNLDDISNLSFVAASIFTPL